MTSSKGFTLIELLIAIFVITVGLTGAFIAAQRGVLAIDYANTRFTAIFLAQEGVEIIKNIRDTNFLEGSAWDDGLPAGNFEVQHTDRQSPLRETAPGYENLSFLRKTEHGFYNHMVGEETRFKRKIQIISVPPDRLELKVTVYWRKMGEGYHKLFLRQHIYNWW